jgi:hypothetical protein
MKLGYAPSMQEQDESSCVAQLTVAFNNQLAGCHRFESSGKANSGLCELNIAASNANFLYSSSYPPNYSTPRHIFRHNLQTVEIYCASLLQTIRS